MTHILVFAVWQVTKPRTLASYPGTRHTLKLFRGFWVAHSLRFFAKSLPAVAGGCFSRIPFIFFSLLSLAIGGHHPVACLIRHPAQSFDQLRWEVVDAPPSVPFWLHGNAAESLRPLILDT